MGTLVLVRHGESQWNLSNRFTGWVDVPLSKNGIKEAEKCAAHCMRYHYTSAYASKLMRAQETLAIILSRHANTGIFQHFDKGEHAQWFFHSNKDKRGDVPVCTHIALNERYYGMLQGMDKKSAEKKYGKKKVFAWRRGYRDRPPQGESLEDTHKRMQGYFVKHILSKVQRGETVLVTAHGNILRGAIKHLENITDHDIAFIDLPEAKPLVYQYSRGVYKRIEGEYRFDRPLR